MVLCANLRSKKLVSWSTWRKENYISKKILGSCKKVLPEKISAYLDTTIGPDLPEDVPIEKPTNSFKAVWK